MAQMRMFLCNGLLLATLLVATPALAQCQPEQAVGEKIADGQAYVTLVRLAHQRNAADNGRILIAYEENGMNGIPIYESRDEGNSWQFVTRAVDGSDHSHCNLHWQPHLTEAPRTIGDIQAGTILLSASDVCNDDNRRMAAMQLQLYTSTDLGHSWQFRSNVAGGTATGPVWEPHLQILDDGSFVTFYSDETRKADGYNQFLGHKVSHDAGKSWGGEVLDTAMKGGVERPGMVIIDRLPDHRYVYNFEDVEGPVENQVHLKFSRDGLDWGDPEARGTAIQTEGGEYPINCPVVRWLPLGGPDGVIVVSARAAAGGGDPSGRSFFWNNNNGVGPWWEVPAPVQKLMNGRSGWTQALLLRPDGKVLHVTSSASADAPNDPSHNQILFAVGNLDFNRYEAEDAARQGSALMRDGSMSNGAKARLGAGDIGRLTFHIHVAKGGAYTLAVNYAGIGFDAAPRLFANGAVLQGSAAPAPVDPQKAAQRLRDLGTRGNGDHMLLSAPAVLKAGDNTIEVGGGAYAVDVDYLEVTPAS